MPVGGCAVKWCGGEERDPQTPLRAHCLTVALPCAQLVSLAILHIPTHPPAPPRGVTSSLISLSRVEEAVRAPAPQSS